MITELRIRTSNGPEGCSEAELGFMEGGRELFAYILEFDSVYYGISEEDVIENDDLEEYISYESREEALRSDYGWCFKILEKAIELAGE